MVEAKGLPRDSEGSVKISVRRRVGALAQLKWAEGAQLWYAQTTRGSAFKLSTPKCSDSLGIGLRQCRVRRIALKHE